MAESKAERLRREAHEAAEIHSYDTHGFCPEAIPKCDCEPCKLHAAIDAALAAARREALGEAAAYLESRFSGVKGITSEIRALATKEKDER